MSAAMISEVTTLAFDIFGTVLDLTGSITPPSRQFLERKGAAVSPETFWDQWRARQRIEQYQDSLMHLGHSGYLETCRRALVYCLRLNGIAFTDEEVRDLMHAWQRLTPHADCAEGLRRLKAKSRDWIDSEQVPGRRCDTGRPGGHAPRMLLAAHHA